MSDQEQKPSHVFVSGSSGSGMTDMLRDFLVDGLGMLLPGFGFLFALLPSLLLPIAWLVIVLDSILGGAGRPGVDYVDIISKIGAMPSPGSFHLEIFLALIGLAFITGHLLFRQDIKKPDRLSFIKALMPDTLIRHRIWRWGLRLLGSDARFPIVWDSHTDCIHNDAEFSLRRWLNKMRNCFSLTLPVNIAEDRWDNEDKKWAQ